MIVPMKKISLVLLDKYKKDALNQLRKLGLVHLETVTGHSSELTKLNSELSKLESAKIYVDEIKLPKKAVYEKVVLSRDEAIEKASFILDLISEKKTLEDSVISDQKELDRLSSWGGVNPKDFDYLKEKNIFLSMYEIQADKYKLVKELQDVTVIYVNSDKNQVRFLCVQDNSERPSTLPQEAYQVPMSEFSTTELIDSCNQNKQRIQEINNLLTDSVKFKETLNSNYLKVSKEVEFENFYSGMAKEENGENSLAWISGFVPASDLQSVITLAKKENWAYLDDDPSEDEEVPTKLKNNKFISLIYPVSDFLGTVPGYTEYDISGWFLLFFTVFLGIIFGDGGYGLLLTAIGLIATLSSIAKKKSVAPMFLLLVILGLTTVIWGTVTCTWFGLTPDKLPQWLKDLSIPYISNAVAAESAEKSNWVSQNLQIFCFILALVQLSIAHFKGIARYHKSLKMLGEIGSLGMLWGLFCIVLNMVVDSERFPIPQAALILIGGGFLLSFIFSSYNGSIKESVLDSCKNIVSVLLGVVNNFSDIVSYIRLWAVGLAGSAIASTVNEMAGPMLGGAIIFAGIILLVFGHGLNMILNVLSVIVHGVRLNTLEFSSHLGMSWSGFKYEPFKETDNK